MRHTFPSIARFDTGVQGPRANISYSCLGFITEVNTWPSVLKQEPIGTSTTAAAYEGNNGILVRAVLLLRRHGGARFRDGGVGGFVGHVVLYPFLRFSRMTIDHSRWPGNARQKVTRSESLTRGEYVAIGHREN